jgi:preprotein translocase SecE subunit
VRESIHEVRHKTTWPDFPQVRQASIAIIIFVLIVGAMITLLDLVLRGVLVYGIQGLFR